MGWLVRVHSVGSGLWRLPRLRVPGSRVSRAGVREPWESLVNEEAGRGRPWIGWLAQEGHSRGV